ncbi:MAG: NUDIX hydrolase [Hyphomicrobiaceae bacterium]
MPNVAELAQCAALPYVELDGDIRVCLITSRGTRRWIIPKGWPKPPLLPHEQAAREAAEEAGLLGEIAADPIGSYTYRKRLHFLSFAVCHVSVFPLHVTAQFGHWPEQAERELIWVPALDAVSMVREPDLGRLLAALPRWIAMHPVD